MSDFTRPDPKWARPRWAPCDGQYRLDVDAGLVLLSTSPTPPWTGREGGVYAVRVTARPPDSPSRSFHLTLSAYASWSDERLAREALVRMAAVPPASSAASELSLVELGALVLLRAGAVDLGREAP